MRGGEAWERWNDRLKPVLLDNQSRDGSWEPISYYADYAQDRDGDRCYTTAMCVLMLEAYYRYDTPLLKKMAESLAAVPPAPLREVVVDQVDGARRRRRRGCAQATSSSVRRRSGHDDRRTRAGERRAAAPRARRAGGPSRRHDAAPPHARPPLRLLGARVA
ncbi:MAG: hypothetical protein R3F20_02925 [Planctomycetota bacterium]